MTVTLGNNSITGVNTLQGPGSNAGITINSGGEVNFPYRPAFYAYGITGGGTSGNTTLICPTAQVNIGGHYNTSNGIFTCPIAGIYTFHWSSIGNNSNATYRMYFRINGSDQAGHHLRLDNTDSGSAYCENLAYAISWDLAANDQVSVFLNTNTWYPGGNSPTNDYWYFTGYLLG